MPAKNALKVYAENRFYHLYNRGVDRRDIFVDDQDFAVFLSYLKTYLLPKDDGLLRKTISSLSSPPDKDRAIKDLALNNFSDKVDLLAYALLPNHFHLLIKQRESSAIDHFLRSLGTRYVGYFNRKYKRVGPLFQGVYKAVLVESEEQLLHLSRYIHLNPIMWLDLTPRDWSSVTLPFSLPEYLGRRQTAWIRPDTITTYFSKSNPKLSYLDFVGSEMNIGTISTVAIDLENA